MNHKLVPNPIIGGTLQGSVEWPQDPLRKCRPKDQSIMRDEFAQKAFADVRAPGKATGNGTTTDCRPPSPLWWVQVRLTTSKGTHPSSVWLSPRRPSVETTHPTPTDDVGDWYVVDADRSGFYRVNYDAENWRRLVRQLSADHSVLAPSMRLRLLDDAFSLGHAGIIGYGTAFRLAEYLTSGVDPFILRIVRRHLQLIQHLAGADSLESSLPDAYPILVRDSSSFWRTLFGPLSDVCSICRMTGLRGEVGRLETARGLVASHQVLADGGRRRLFGPIQVRRQRALLHLDGYRTVQRRSSGPADIRPTPVISLHVFDPSPPTKFHFRSKNIQLAK